MTKRVIYEYRMPGKVIEVENDRLRFYRTNSGSGDKVADSVIGLHIEDLLKIIGEYNKEKE